MEKPKVQWKIFEEHVRLSKGDYIRSNRGTTMEVSGSEGNRGWFIGRWVETDHIGYCFLLDVVDYAKFPKS